MRKKEKKKWLTLCAGSFAVFIPWFLLFAVVAKEHLFFVCVLFLAAYLFLCTALFTAVQGGRPEEKNDIYLVYQAPFSVAQCYEKLEQTERDNYMAYQVNWWTVPSSGSLMFTGANRYFSMMRIRNTQYQMILMPQADETVIIECTFLPDQSRWRMPEMPPSWIDEFFRQKLEAVRLNPYCPPVPESEETQ